MTGCTKQMDIYRHSVEAALAGLMDESKAPEPLLGAMRYSLLGGGKRLRAILLLASCEAAGGRQSQAMPCACALEMIHAYSLIHDDLPAMDDDDMRRGKPTSHKVYGEAVAILAGDGLLSLAFETMLHAARRREDILAMQSIARAAGTVGMVAGQSVDVTCEANKIGGADELVYIHQHKTADLFIGAAEAGLQLAGASPDLLRAGEAYARSLGIAFQIRDDLLDIEGDAQALGKATGMDAARGKLTWPSVFGVESAREAVAEHTQSALAALAPFGARGAFLKEMARALLERDR